MASLPKAFVGRLALSRRDGSYERWSTTRSFGFSWPVFRRLSLGGLQAFLPSDRCGPAFVLVAVRGAISCAFGFGVNLGIRRESGAIVTCGTCRWHVPTRVACASRRRRCCSAQVPALAA